MFSDVRIQNFRGLRDVQIRQLQRINLLVGRNNTGKTSILEALFLLGGASSPGLPGSLGLLRGHPPEQISPEPIWRSLFHGMDVHASTPVISGQWNDEPAERALTISAHTSMRMPENEAGIISSTQADQIDELWFRYRNAKGNLIETSAHFSGRTYYSGEPQSRDDFVTATFLSARSFSSLERNASQFSQLVKSKQEPEVVEALRIVDPRILGIEAVWEWREPSIYIDVGLNELMPLHACGEGLVRFFSIVVELLVARGGYLLIDEIDNGLHHSVMEKLWKLLSRMALAHDVQIFATTHNDEMIRTALEMLQGDDEHPGLYRLDVTGDGHRVVSYDAGAQRGVLAGNFEVRA